MAKTTRKFTTWRIILLTLTVALLFILGFVVYDWWMERRAHFVRYAAFGIEVPIIYTIHGIDVSRYQDAIDWESVKEMNVGNVRMSFAFIKATEGLGNEDDHFRRNWKKARNAGIARGAYHFFLATKSGKAQAENFINSVELLPGDLPPVLDIEQTYGVSPERLRERAKEWLQTVHDYYGIVPIVYTNVDFYRQYLKDDFDSYPLWVAHYLQKERPRITRDWTFWQHSESGRVNGIVTRVDFDVFSGDSTDFRKLLIDSLATHSN
ncbi:MAG TPA: GH25 family lysozyme [Puia sp.]|jgi:lysozyme|nr:GH25 family lysozyme [Puia sp.]